MNAEAVPFLCFLFFPLHVFCETAESFWLWRGGGSGGSRWRNLAGLLPHAGIGEELEREGGREGAVEEARIGLWWRGGCAAL